jgi:hypothetical protein
VNALPLLAPRDLAAPLAWRAGVSLSGAQFVAQATRLAERLPATGRPINLCQDRLHFALGLAAALLRGQTSLLPPNALPATLRQLLAGRAPIYALADAAGVDAGGLPLRVVPELLGAESDAASGTPTDGNVPALDPGLEAVSLLTSGSTGAPQPHGKRWGPLVANIGAEAARLAELLERPSLAGLTLVATVPPQHSYGLESTVLLALLGGAAFEAGRPFYPADIVAALAAVPRPRALVTTPFHLKALLQSGLALPPTELLLSATAPLAPQLAVQAEAASGGRLIEIYGCTEAGQVASRRTTAGQTWTTLGELRLSRAGDEDAAGERFVVSGGHVTEPTPLADILELHDARHFRLLGRANDLIHVAGKRSSLAHLNFQLNRIDGVEDGTFWLPDERPGEVVRPVAFVVAPRLTAREIVAALRGEVEDAFLPRRVVQVEALPRESTGKLTAAALRDFALERLGAGAAGGLPGAGRPDGAAAGAAVETPGRTVRAPGGRQGRSVLQVPPDHPAFAGHFPGRPMLPGAALLAMVIDAVQADPARRTRPGTALAVPQVKFLGPVAPGATLTLEWRDADAPADTIAFEVREGPRPVARGQIGRL